METKINVAKILKNKPEGTKLWTDMFGEVTLYVVTDKCDAFQVKHHNKTPWFDENGKMYEEGVLCIYPSKSMRDWRKFNWKKGDVLISNDGKKEVFFNGFTDDTYALFKAKHGFEILSDGNTIYLADEDGIATSDYTLETEEAAKTYINTIEERLGFKLNLETLVIEKAQTEFKNGDIVVTDAVPSLCYSKCIFILKGGLNTGESCANSYIFYNIDNNVFCFDVLDTEIRYRNIRLATEEEKKQLFSALEKEGKAWDSEKKQVVNLKPKVEFKPFDKVLCRNSKDDTWEADFFARLTRKEIDYTQTGKYLCVGDLWMYCIPYNEETAHLLGTTDEWKGGEG